MHQALGTDLQKLREVERLRSEDWARAYELAKTLETLREFADEYPGSTVEALLPSNEAGKQCGIRLSPPNPRRT